MAYVDTPWLQAFDCACHWLAKHFPKGFVTAATDALRQTAHTYLGRLS